MKPSLVVNHLAKYIPRFVNNFTDIIPFQTIEAINGVVTVTTELPHNLANNAFITLGGMQIKRNIVSLVQNEQGYADALLDSDHDLTLNWQTTVTIEGANQSEYNGTFELTDVPNRRTFTYKLKTESAPAMATGTNIKFVETLEYGFDGAYRIVIVNDHQFTFVLDNRELNLEGFNGTITRGQRILATPSIEHFLKMYEEKPPAECHMIVVMDDGSTSKSRLTSSDAVGWADVSTDLRAVFLEGFSVFVVYPCKNNVAGLEAMDFCNDEMLVALMNTLFGYKFQIGFANETTTGCFPVSHGVTAYSKAYYIHQYQFQSGFELTVDDSIAINPLLSPTRAFRDVVLTINAENKQIVFSNNINLDDEPLTT